MYLSMFLDISHISLKILFLEKNIKIWSSGVVKERYAIQSPPEKLFNNISIGYNLNHK